MSSNKVWSLSSHFIIVIQYFTVLFKELLCLAFGLYRYIVSSKELFVVYRKLRCCINLHGRQNISWLLFSEERRSDGVAEARVRRPGASTWPRVSGCCRGGLYRRSLPHDDLPQEREGIDVQTVTVNYNYT